MAIYAKNGRSSSDNESFFQPVSGSRDGSPESPVSDVAPRANFLGNPSQTKPGSNSIKSDKTEANPADQPCYAVSLVRPFFRVLRNYNAIPEELINSLDRFDADERIPVTSANKRLQIAVELTGDQDIGLKAARELALGEIGAFDYAMSSAATVGEAIEVAKRFRRLISDTIDFRLQLEGSRAILHVENCVVTPRAAVDFKLAIFYRNHFGDWPRDADTGYEVYFTHAKPESTEEYERSFPGAAITFSAPFTGYVFMKSELDQPLKTANATLHAIIRKHAEGMLATLPKTQSVTEKVRELVMADLSTGGPYAKRISRKLQISARTLIRRLEQEGTTFKDVVDDVRRQLALSYVGGRDIDFTDVAVMLGFSHVTAFHRAFRRWTDQTPLEYRRARRWYKPAASRAEEFSVAAAES